MKSKQWRYVFSLIAVFILFAAAVAIGWRTADQHSYKIQHAHPLLDPSVSSFGVHQEIINFDPLRQNLKSYLAGLPYGHSLYFEYLPNGASIRDGADQTSTAASLMKTPVVMDLYKLSEAGKINLDKVVTVTQADINKDSIYGNPTKLNAGGTISLRAAAQITLQQSDNTTLNIIKDKVLPLLDDDTDSIQSLDVSYSLTGTNPGNEVVSISSRSYASILKCLYYACFLNPADSQSVIDQLSGSVERNRIMSGLPAGIRVAHKVGSSDTTQSDCGIIYYPGKPYLICLMFMGSDVTNTGVDVYFKHVSQEIYKYVSTSGQDY